ncbi:TrkH family potassium uptake protein [Leptolyngbya ohadii]|uniref:TrkH family potassium uptake protein n=1 Tax=Leptolyngbya ohadii TaxID=1962290 RepID=UPI000B59ED0C|nr:TrkH family potassium uptake protein [Leptolyngbya ohadii]
MSSKFVTVPRTICFGFLAVISFGTILLMLPISIAEGTWGDFITAFFTSTSAVCVTGLVVVDTGTYFSFWGQLFIMLLIQVGGLGYMTATTFLLLILGRRFGLRERLAIQQSLDSPGLSGVVQLVKSIIAMTLIFELTGAFVMILVFAPQHGFDRALWLGIFHSVSAFNNAGFGLFPDNMISYATNLPINLIIPLLIIFGGIGYQVIYEMYLWLRDRLTRSRERIVFPLNFKIVTSTTIFLLLLGTIAFLYIEYNNPETFGQYNFTGKLMVAWFQAVVPRTAGFNSIDYGKMTDAGLFITIALMFIGASPGSTGGGIKTTTFRILYECTKAVLQGKEEVLCYQREIPIALIRKAVGVVFGSLTTVVLATVLIAISDPQVEFIRVLFEAVSAFATVGLSTGITASFSVFAKLVLIATMYIGRVGILLLMSAILGDPTPTRVRYPEENLLVG